MATPAPVADTVLKSLPSCVLSAMSPVAVNVAAPPTVTAPLCVILPSEAVSSVALTSSAPGVVISPSAMPSAPSASSTDFAVPCTVPKSLAPDLRDTVSVAASRLSVSVSATILSPASSPPCDEVSVSTISPASSTAVPAAASFAFCSSFPSIVILVTPAPPIVPSSCRTSPMIVIVPSPLSTMVHPSCSTLASITFALRVPSFVCTNFSAVSLLAVISPPSCVRTPSSPLLFLTTRSPVPLPSLSASTVPLRVTPSSAVSSMPSLASSFLPAACSIFFEAVNEAVSAETSS